MEIHVIRHTTVSIPQGICYGQADLLPADTFEQEANAIFEKLPPDFEKVYCSPLKRCFALANHLPYTDISPSKALLELNFGDWEQIPWNEIPQAELSQWMDDFVHHSPPNGENFASMYDRVATFIDHLRHENYERVLIVTHAGVIRCFWAYLLQIPLKNVFKIPVGFGEVLHLNLGENNETDYIVRKM